MGLAQWARNSNDWAAYERERDAAIHLLLTHRIEDEVSRYRQVMSACTGCQVFGDDARRLMLKALAEAFLQGLERRENAHDLIVGMHRIPRAQATRAVTTNMRLGDGETCVAFLLTKDGVVADKAASALGTDPGRIAAKFTARDWANLATPLLKIAPGELRQDLVDEACRSLRRVLSEVASR